MIKIARYGWKRGLPVQAKKFSAPMGLGAIPDKIDLEPQFDSVYDQGMLGSCTANSAAAFARYLNKMHGFKDYMTSRLALYYWTRQYEGNVGEDSGATLASTMKVLTVHGAPNESLMPYHIQDFRKKPDDKVVANGKLHLVMEPLQVNQNIGDMKACLAAGFPFIFGFSVYKSFESDVISKTGIMPMPKSDEDICGGHAVCAVGYDDSTKLFKIRNSWGKAWGKNGYFFMPYEFIASDNFAADFWTAHSMKGFMSPV